MIHTSYMIELPLMIFVKVSQISLIDQVVNFLLLVYACQIPLKVTLFSLRIQTVLFPAEAAPFCNVGPLSFVKGQTAKIECDFMGYTGHLLWFKDGKLLKNGTQGLYQSSVQLSNGTTRSTLQFPVVKMNHEASYRCEAANSRMTRGCPNGKTTSVVVLCEYNHIQISFSKILMYTFN